MLHFSYCAALRIIVGVSRFQDEVQIAPLISDPFAIVGATHRIDVTLNGA